MRVRHAQGESLCHRLCLRKNYLNYSWGWTMDKISYKNYPLPFGYEWDLTEKGGVGVKICRQMREDTGRFEYRAWIALNENTKKWEVEMWTAKNSSGNCWNQLGETDTEEEVLSLVSTMLFLGMDDGP